MRLTHMMAVLWFAGAVLQAVAEPATLHVWSEGGNVWPYDTWAKASTTIQSAVTAAPPGAVVLVTNGTYTAGIDLLQVVFIDKAITLRSVNGPEVTIIDAENLTGRRVLTMTNNAAGALVEGFTFTRGRITSTAGIAGAGIRMSDGVVSGCVVSNNAAASNGNGGGIYMTGGMVSNTVIRNNSSHFHGGGVYMDGGGILHSSVIRNNTSGGNPTGNGGGVYMTGASSMVDSCCIHDNAGGVSGYGGGIDLRAGSVMRNSIISGNRAAHA